MVRELMEKIKLNEPDLGVREIEAATNVLLSGTLTAGPKTQEFEQSFGLKVGANSAVAVSSATAGLELSLWAAGLGPGDEVIVPDYSWPATGNAVIARGATPVFVDIELETFCLDPNELERVLTPRTRAIMPVHAFGHMANMPEITRFASRHDLKVIEDAACAFGSRLLGEHAGKFGDFGVFSFHPRKIVTTGEGGMVLAKDARHLDRVKTGRTHGFIRGELFAEFHDFGFNFRMSEIQAAIGVVQMERSSEILQKRREVAIEMAEEIQGLVGLRSPIELEGYTHSYQSFVVLLEDHIDRDQVIRSLLERGIESTLGTYSMMSQPVFKNRFGDMSTQLRNSFKAFSQVLSLPLHTKMSTDQIDFVCANLESILGEAPIASHV